MRAGQLRHWLTLEAPSAPTGDGDGGIAAPSWAPLSPSVVKGAIESLAGTKRALQGTVLSSATHVVTLRYHSGVTTKTRIRFGTRTFKVTGLANIEERGRELRVECIEVVT